MDQFFKQWQREEMLKSLSEVIADKRILFDKFILDPIQVSDVVKFMYYPIFGDYPNARDNFIILQFMTKGPHPDQITIKFYFTSRAGRVYKLDLDLNMYVLSEYKFDVWLVMHEVDRALNELESVL